MAPYVIAHFKINLKLRETGYQFDSSQRAHIYLTNALEPAKDKKQLSLDFALPALAEEGIQADKIKRSTRFTVILGNPPYSGHSANEGEWIKNLLHGDSGEGSVENYFRLGGEPLKEVQIKWLYDDYVKFTRLAHYQIERAGQGVLGFITNHGYLDNPTFRGMRESLISTFTNQYLLDLHGNSKKKERSPTGGKDENVFDIQQGVAIGLFVRGYNLSESVQHHLDLWGNRETSDQSGKYDILESNNVSKLKWNTVTPKLPFCFLIPFDYERYMEYELGWKLTDFLPTNSVGLLTARDKLTIQFTQENIETVVNNFVDLEVEEARISFHLSKDSRDWKIDLAQKDIKRNRGKICSIFYRPFDTRFTYYTGTIKGFICRPCHNIMRHMLDGTNVALVFSRQNIPPDPPVVNVMVADTIVDGHANYTSNGVTNLAPLYLHPEENSLQQKEVNLQHDIRAEIISLAQHPEFGTPNELEIFDYIYAALQCPAYQKAYSAFLKEDFPRIPKPSSPKEFWDVSRKGEQLRKLHLFKDSRLKHLPNTFAGEGNNIVDTPRYQNGRIRINKTQGFDGVVEHVWNCYVGGFQVARKWLKDRKSRQLQPTDIEHYQRILKVLDETESIRKSITMDI